MANRIAGVAFVAIDGNSYALAGAGSYQVSGSSREVLNGQDGFHGFSEVPRPGMISWSFRDGAEVSITALNEMADATVTLELANGKIIIARNAVRIGEPLKVNSEDGTGDIEFYSPEVTEN
jgi:hypothetical protein